MTTSTAVTSHIKRGRPSKYSLEDIINLQYELQEYIKNTEIPSIQEFAYQNDMSRDDLYNQNEFNILRKKLITKKEAQLEKLSLEGKINTTQAIFSLKQLGWRNDPEPEVKEINIIKVKITEE